MNQKNMTYLADLIKNEVGEVKIKNFIIYDVTLPLFEDIYYTDSEVEEDFLKLMKMFSCDSKKEIEKMIKGNHLLEEVYGMQKKLNSDEFILEHFPDELYHELEKKEFLEKGREEGKIETTLEFAKKMLKEGASVDFTMKVNGLSREKLEDCIKK